MRFPLVLTASIPLLLAAPAWAEGPAQCPADQRVKVDLKAWKQALLKARPGSPAQRQALEDLHFDPIAPKSVEEDEPECLMTPQVKGVELFPARLSGGAQPDTVVQARFESCPEIDAIRLGSLRIAVLRPLGKDEYCAVGARELSFEQDGRSQPCVGTPTKLPRLFFFVNLTDARRQTLQLKDRSGTCHGHHGSALETTSYWDVRDNALVKLFEATLWEVSYSSPHPTEETFGTVVLQGGFPKTIVYKRRVFCGDPDPDEKREGEACTPSTDRTKWVFREGRYVKE
jgi:hypothetical protein